MRRFQFIADATPDNAAREQSGQRIVEIERGSKRPQKEVCEAVAPQLSIVSRKRDTDSSPAQVSLQSTECVDCEDESKWKDIRKPEHGARDCESNPAEEDSREK